MRGMTVKLIFGLFLVLALGLAYVWQSRTTHLANAMSEMLGVEVTIDDIQLGFTGVTVHGVTVGNVPNGKLDNSLKIPKIDVKMGITDLFKETMEVQDIHVANPHFGVELFGMTGKDNNWSRIMKNMESGQDPNAEPQKLLIRHLLIDDIQVTAVGGAIGNTPKELSIDEPLEVNNVGGDQPLPYDQLTAMIVKAVMKQISGLNVLKGIGDGFMNTTGDIMKKPVELLDKVLPSGSKSTDEGGGLLKGIFGGSKD